MGTTIDSKLDNIEHFLKRIETKMDNFMGFENISEEERKEILKIKQDMGKGDFSDYEEVFE